jgi:hypothetical protein
MSSAFQQYRACIEFVEIEGSHSGENLANIQPSKDSAIEDAEDIKIRSSLPRASSRRHNRRDTTNAHWMSSAFQQYRACIEFVEIEGSHSGENLANISDLSNHPNIARLRMLKTLRFKAHCQEHQAEDIIDAAQYPHLVRIIANASHSCSLDVLCLPAISSLY